MMGNGWDDAYKFTSVEEFQKTLFYSLGEVF